MRTEHRGHRIPQLQLLFIATISDSLNVANDFSETVSAEDKAITYAMPTETENASLSAVVSESIFDEWSTILNETVEDTAPLDLMKMEKLSDESFAITISSILPSD